MLRNPANWLADRTGLAKRNPETEASKKLGTGDGVVCCSKPRGSTVFRETEAPNWSQKLDGNTRSSRRWSFHLLGVQEL